MWQLIFKTTNVIRDCPHRKYEPILNKRILFILNNFVFLQLICEWGETSYEKPSDISVEVYRSRLTDEIDTYPSAQKESSKPHRSPLLRKLENRRKEESILKLSDTTAAATMLFGESIMFRKMSISYPTSFVTLEIQFCSNLLDFASEER